jgi:hypothetical protein
VRKLPAEGLIGSWVVAGRTVVVTPATPLKEDNAPVKIGAKAEVEGSLESDGINNPRKMIAAPLVILSRRNACVISRQSPSSYHILISKSTSPELGADFFDKIHPLKVVFRLTKRIESLGYSVQVALIPVAA